MSEVGKVSLGIELGGNVERQIEGAAANLGKSFSAALKSSFQGVMKGFQAASKTTPAPAPKIDVAKAQAEIEQLTAVLDNVNARLDFQNRKLADLKEQYNNTFNEARKTKLEGQILNTEATILRLEKQSDSTAAKIWKLEDSIAQAGQATQQTHPPLTDMGQRMKKVAKESTNLGRALKATGKSANGMGNQFTQAFKRIAKQVLIFSVIYRAIRGLQSYISSSLRTNQEYAKSFAQLQMNLKAAFNPIFQAALPAINALIKAMVTATTYVAAFTSALFGKTYKQSLEAAKGLDKARAAMDKTAKSANKLAGFDELNLLETGDGDDGGFGEALSSFETPELDVDRIQTQMDALALGIRSTFERAFQGIRSGWDGAVLAFGPGIQKAWGIIQPELSKWKEQFRVVFADIISLGEPLKNWWQNSVIPTWQQNVASTATIFAGLTESVRMAFASIWEAAFPIIEKFVADGLPRITAFAAGVQGIFESMFGVIKTIFDSIWQGAVDPVLQFLSQAIRDVLDIMLGWWDDWGQKIVANISTTFEKIKELWSSLWQKFLQPIITKMLGAMKKLWDDHLKGLVKELGVFIGKLVTAAQDIFNKFIMPIAKWLVDKLGPVFAKVFGRVIDIVGGVLGSIIDAAAGILKALGGVIDFIAGVFTGDWKKAWEGVKTIFKGVFDALVGIVKYPLNLIIDAFNALIGGLNKISFDIPDWVPGLGGKKFGFNIPNIPKLAKGGLVSAPTLAMVGDNPHANVDPEVVSPLSKLQEMLGGSNQETVEVLYMILSALQDFARRPVILEANGTQLAKVVDGARDDRMRRAGRTLALT